MTIRHNITVVSRNGIGSKGFGFCTVGDGGKDAFVHQDDITAAGFDTEAYQTGDELIADVKEFTDNRRRVTAIHQLNQVWAPAHYVERDIDRHAGKVIVKVAGRHNNRPVEFRVYTEVGGTRRLYSTHPSLGEARDYIGKAIEPPTPTGHGKKTNTPVVSQAMAQAKGDGGGKKQKKAA